MNLDSMFIFIFVVIRGLLPAVFWLTNTYAHKNLLLQSTNCGRIFFRQTARGLCCPTFLFLTWSLSKLIFSFLHLCPDLLPRVVLGASAKMNAGQWHIHIIRPSKLAQLPPQSPQYQAQREPTCATRGRIEAQYKTLPQGPQKPDTGTTPYLDPAFILSPSFLTHHAHNFPWHTTLMHQPCLPSLPCLHPSRFVFLFPTCAVYGKQSFTSLQDLPTRSR